MRCSLPLLLLGVSCTPPGLVPEPRGAMPSISPAEATLRRLTEAEYLNTLGDLLGDGLLLPTALEPDVEIEGLLHVGAGQTALSPRGIEQYEDAAFLLAEQVVADPALRARVFPCDAPDPGCTEAFARTFGRLAWRRSLTPGELEQLEAIASEARAVLPGEPWAGHELVLAALLQSPHFLYRIELGAGGRFVGTELASRLSYLLWAGPPDEALLDAAEAGALEEAAALREQVQRMIADQRARRGLRAFFSELLGLHELDTLTKDPAIFVHYSDTLGASAREETLRTVEHLAFEQAGDYRDLLVTHTTFVDRQLAAIYEVPAPTLEGFGEVLLPPGPRAGLLGQVSFLARLAHPVSTSVTRRGEFVRQTLLCHEIPPPPADVDTSIPEASSDAQTMRDRVAIHLEDPACAGCHQITDPIGLGLEQFDGIGRFRTEEGTAPIDPGGDLDGVPFSDALGLGFVLRGHPDLPACLAQTWLAWAVGHPLTPSEGQLAGWHADGMALQGHQLLWLLEDLATSDAFRIAGSTLGGGR
ncbi:MAG TPA: DUF1592 domain-containing protein [Deltaproteobacteria bacterium]|nr:DUF1592 domain-containing protein [Deltaproteobacteria bacterium]